MPGGLGPLLQADPAFASGASSFSSGLETLVADGFVTDAATLSASMIDAVRLRWNTFDRVFLVRSHTEPDEGARLIVDLEAEVCTLGTAARSASRRAGTALLGTWARLGLAEAEAYRARVRAEPGTGHLAVAQGLIHRAHGLTLEEAEALACWAVLSAAASGAIRLGVVGHRAAQNALIQARHAVEPLLAVPVASDAEPHAFLPVADIAVERHGLAELKLFAS